MVSILSTSPSTSPTSSARFLVSASSTLTLSRSGNGAGYCWTGSIKSGGFCYRMPEISAHHRSVTPELGTGKDLKQVVRFLDRPAVVRQSEVRRPLVAHELGNRGRRLVHYVLATPASARFENYHDYTRGHAPPEDPACVQSLLDPYHSGGDAPDL
jgi:hypothetical protein